SDEPQVASCMAEARRAFHADVAERTFGTLLMSLPRLLGQQRFRSSSACRGRSVVVFFCSPDQGPHPLEVALLRYRYPGAPDHIELRVLRSSEVVVRLPAHARQRSRIALTPPCTVTSDTATALQRRVSIVPP